MAPEAAPDSRGVGEPGEGQQGIDSTCCACSSCPGQYPEGCEQALVEPHWWFLLLWVGGSQLFPE